MRCYRKILHISYKDHATNEEARAKIQQAMGLHEDLLTIVKRRKLQWYGHVSRSSGLAKTILHGTVKGGRRQGGQRKRLEDNIREWTGLEFGRSQRAVENREKLRKLVVKSSAVPQRPSRLKDRWWWWWWWLWADLIGWSTMCTFHSWCSGVRYNELIKQTADRSQSPSMAKEFCRLQVDNVSWLISS